MGKIKYGFPKTNYAFVDGSYNPATKVYGCGGFLVDAIGVRHKIQAKGNDPKLAAMRNVAGEIMGAKMAINLAGKLGLKQLTIFYDYEGIAKWPLGLWHAKKKATRDYAKFVNDACKKYHLDLYFHHTKAHAGIKGNEEADRLAKEAVGLLGKVVAA